MIATDSLTSGLAITDEHAFTRITVKHEQRAVGIVEGSDERGYVATYWWPATRDRASATSAVENRQRH